MSCETMYWKQVNIIIKALFHLIEFKNRPSGPKSYKLFTSFHLLFSFLGIVFYCMLCKGEMFIIIILVLCIVGGVPNVNAAGKMVLKDWNRFVMSYLLYEEKSVLLVSVA